jgi:hypothetical protein
MRLWLAKWLCPTSHIVVPREPTTKMKRAACRSMAPDRREGKPWVSNSEKHGIRYKAMCDAYLAEAFE